VELHDHGHGLITVETVKAYYLPRLANVHEFQLDARWDYPTHRHVKTCDMVICVSGTVENQINGQTLSVGPGQMSIVHDDDVHAIGGRNLHFFNIDVLPSVMDLVADGMGIRDHYKSFSGKRPRRVFDLGEYRNSILWKIRQLMQHQYGPDASIYLRSLLADVMTVIALTETESEMQLIPWMQTACEHVELNVGIVKAGDLPEVCERSAAHVSRSFKRAFRKTPSQYVTDLRIERAATRLAASNDDISAICFDLGFGSLSYFYRLFRERKGMPPLKFRKANNPYYG